MKAPRIITTMVALALCSGAVAQEGGSRAVKKYQPFFDEIQARNDFVMEIRHGVAQEEFATDDQGITKPTDAFLKSAEAIEISVDGKDAGRVAMKDLILGYTLDRDKTGEGEKKAQKEGTENDESYQIKMVMLQKAGAGYSAFRSELKAAPDQWFTLAGVIQELPDDEKQYSYILLRLRQNTPQ